MRREGGGKRDKISNKNHPKNHQHISYNSYFKQEGHDGPGSLT